MTPVPECRLGGPCDLTFPAVVMHRKDDTHPRGWVEQPGLAQCRRCSTVYEATGWEPRRCGACGLFWGESLHDPCLGELAGVEEACCGHGNEAQAYRTHRTVA